MSGSHTTMSRQYASLIGPRLSFLQATFTRAAGRRQHSPCAVARELLLEPPLESVTEGGEEAFAGRRGVIAGVLVLLVPGVEIGVDARGTRVPPLWTIT